MRILFITSTRVGDAILSTGLLDHLIGRHPGARVTVACGPAAASLFEAVPGLERIIVLRKMVGSLHWPQLWAATSGRVWDALVDLRGSPMSYVLAARRRWRISRALPSEHRIQQLARVLGLADDPPPPKLWINGGHEEEARRLIPDGPPVLAVGPTANWRAKTWPAENFTQLIDRLTSPSGILPGGRVAVFGRDDERPSALGLIESIPEDKRIDLVGRIELPAISACFRRSALYVGNDSGLMHLAAASGVPTLGLFGPSPAFRYAPWGPLCAVAHTRVAYEDIFPAQFDHQNSDSLMGSLDVDNAEGAARELWRNARESRA